MPKVLVSVDDSIWEAVRRRHRQSKSDGVGSYISELIHLGFEQQFVQLYEEYAQGHISLGKMAEELGFGVRELYAELEKRELPTSNITPDALAGMTASR